MTAAAWKLNIMPVSNCCSAVIRFLIAFYLRAGPADPAGGAARGAGLPPDWGGPILEQNAVLVNVWSCIYSHLLSRD